MGLYDNAFPTLYEEIKRYYPVWYWDVQEMDAIWRVQGGQLEQVRNAVESLIADQFIATSDAATITALEEFLGIAEDSSRTMSDRRQLLNALLSGNSHIGTPEIKEMVAAFTEGEIDVHFDRGEVAVEVKRELAGRFNRADCARVLYSRLPAHLSLLFIDIINPILFIHEPNILTFHRFKMATSVSNVRGKGAFPRLIITTNVPHGEDLTGTIVIDSWYTLDGMTALDGSKLLNARYIKEDI